MSLLDELKATGQAQLLATHDPRLLPRCDRVVALGGGRVVFDGPPESFLANPPYSPPQPWRDGTAIEEAAR
jgi:energy-coupling factor transporter ATP-binding protein EcfA2